MAEFTDEDRELIPALGGGKRQPTRPVTYKIEGDCWICTSHKGLGFGYPNIKIDKQSFSLPRLICLLFNEPQEINEVVLHSCDNPLCINPVHLRMGTQRENIKGMWDRGRGKPMNIIPPEPRRGENCNFSKLTVISLS